MKYHRWTLLEGILIVVIVIMAAMMILPALKTKQGAAVSASPASPVSVAEKLTCQDNLRKIGIMVLSYADRNQGYLPSGNSCHQTGQDATGASCIGMLFRAESASHQDYSEVFQTPEAKIFRCPDDPTPANPALSGYMWWYIGKECTHHVNPEMKRYQSRQGEYRKAIASDLHNLPGLLDNQPGAHADNSTNVLYDDGRVAVIMPEDFEGISGWDHLLNFDVLYPENQE